MPSIAVYNAPRVSLEKAWFCEANIQLGKRRSISMTKGAAVQVTNSQFGIFSL